MTEDTTPPNAERPMRSQRGRAERRLRDLQDIAILLSRFEGIGNTVTRMLAVVARTLPLHTAVVVDATDRDPRLVAWKAAGADDADAARASLRARTVYAWLRGSRERIELQEENAGEPLVSQDALEDESARFFVLPLTVDGRTVFGILQLQCMGPLAETDLVFANALSSQLALALDRERIRRADLVAQESLREQLDFTRAVAASLGEAVVAVDAGGQIRLLNRAAEVLLKADADAIGRSFYDVATLVTPQGRFVDPIARAMRTGLRVESASHSLQRPDGTFIPVSYACTPVRGGPGQGAVIALQDIRERRRAEATQAFLLEASQRLGATLDFAMGVRVLCDLAVPFLADCAFLDVLVEGRVERAAWKHRTDAGQRVLDDLFREEDLLDPKVHPAQRALVSGQTIVRPRVTEGEIELQAFGRPATGLRHLGIQSLITVPVAVGHTRIGALTLCHAESGRRHDPRDVVLAKELAQRAAFALENSRSYADARRAIALREQVLAIVSHDLRVPLSTVMLSADFIALTADAEGRASHWRLRDAATRVTQAAQWMSRLIEDLLDFASIEAGCLRIVRTENDVHRLVEEAAASFDRQAQEAGLELRIACLDDPSSVTCDRGRILQVFSNLIGNALKLTPRGGSVTLGAERRHRDTLFFVRDTGPGLSPHDLAHVFERYWRGEARYRGTGLGLSIARGIVEAHGGRIWVESIEGEGATFSFTVPDPEPRAEPSGPQPESRADG